MTERIDPELFRELASHLRAWAQWWQAGARFYDMQPKSRNIDHIDRIVRHDDALALAEAIEALPATLERLRLAEGQLAEAGHRAGRDHCDTERLREAEQRIKELELDLGSERVETGRLQGVLAKVGRRAIHDHREAQAKLATVEQRLAELEESLADPGYQSCCKGSNYYRGQLERAERKLATAKASADARVDLFCQERDEAEARAVAAEQRCREHVDAVLGFAAGGQAAEIRAQELEALYVQQKDRAEDLQHKLDNEQSQWESRARELTAVADQILRAMGLDPPGLPADKARHGASRARELQAERDQARATAAILAHAYEHDARPPDSAVAVAKSWQRWPSTPPEPTGSEGESARCDWCGAELASGETCRPCDDRKIFESQPAPASREPERNE